MHAPQNIPKTKIVSLLTILGEVPDPRVARTREHDLVELLVALPRFGGQGVNA